MANSVDTDQTAPGSSLIWVCIICTCHFIGNVSVRNFRAFTVLLKKSETPVESSHNNEASHQDLQLLPFFLNF